MKCSSGNGRTLISVAVVDTAPLVAAAVSDEPLHDQCVDVLSRGDLHFVIPAMVVAEATFMIAAQLGPAGEAEFLRALDDWEVEAPRPEDWSRIAGLVEQYADLGLGGTDASVIATAERLDATVIATLDRRHFPVVRPRHIDAFELLPD